MIERQVNRICGGTYGEGARGWFKRAKDRRQMVRLGHKIERREGHAHIASALEDDRLDLLLVHEEQTPVHDEELMAEIALDRTWAAQDYEYRRMDEDMSELEQTYPVWLLMRVGWYSTWSQSDEWAA